MVRLPQRVFRMPELDRSDNGADSEVRQQSQQQLEPQQRSQSQPELAVSSRVEPLLQRPGHLSRNPSLAQLAREHMLRERDVNDIRRFFSAEIGIGAEDEVSRTPSRSPSPMVSAQASSAQLNNDYFRNDHLERGRVRHSIPHHHHHHRHHPHGFHAHLEDGSLIFRTGSRMFSQSEFELGIGGETFLDGHSPSRPHSRTHSPSRSRPASRRESLGIVGSETDDDDDDEFTAPEDSIYAGGSGSDDEDDVVEDGWALLANSRLVQWTDWLLGLGGSDSLSGIHEFLREPRRPVGRAEKRRLREQSILTDPALFIGIAMAFISPRSRS